MGVLLALHTIFAILCGVCTVMTTSMFVSILYAIAMGVWCICIGMDIVLMSSDDIKEKYYDGI